MAQKAEPNEVVKRLEEQITCPICLDCFSDPKLLPCGHSFCLNCLQSVLKDLDQHSFDCPECRKPCPLTDNDPVSLPPSFTANSLIEVYDQLKQLHISDPTAQTGVAKKCDNCDKSDANRYCQQCSMFICMKCLVFHNNWRPNFNHELVCLKEVDLTSAKFDRTRPAEFDTLAMIYPSGTRVPSHADTGQQKSSKVSSIRQTGRRGRSPDYRQTHVVSKLTRSAASQRTHSTNSQGPSVSRPVAVQQDIPLGCPFPELEEPSGVAVTDDGLVVVSEYGCHCITVLNRNGKKIRSFGCKGKKKGQLVDPQGIAVTSTGTILVADSGNHRIQEFTIDGTCVSCVGGKGDGSLQFKSPHGIAIHKRTGHVFIADNDNNRVQVLRPDLKFAHVFGSFGISPSSIGKGCLNRPHDIAVDSQGYVYVTNYYNYSVSKFRANGQFISLFGIDESDQDKLLHPSGIAIDDRNRLYVNNSWNDRVTIFNTDGQRIGSISKEVIFTPILFYPPLHGIAIDKTTGRAIVCIRSKNRIEVLDN